MPAAFEACRAPSSALAIDARFAPLLNAASISSIHLRRCVRSACVAFPNACVISPYNFAIGLASPAGGTMPNFHFALRSLRIAGTTSRASSMVPARPPFILNNCDRVEAKRTSRCLRILEYRPLNSCDEQAGSSVHGRNAASIISAVDEFPFRRPLIADPTHSNSKAATAGFQLEDGVATLRN